MTRITIEYFRFIKSGWWFANLSKSDCKKFPEVRGMHAAQPTVPELKSVVPSLLDDLLDCQELPPRKWLVRWRQLKEARE